MSDISVAEILKIHGKWIETTGLAELVADKLRITQRHAYNKIKKAWDNREILKVELPNRAGVLCGLAEFGPSFIEKIDGKSSKKDRVITEYSQLDPENAEIVANIDFFLEYFIDKNNPENQKFISLLKMMRDYHVRVGKARGR